MNQAARTFEHVEELGQLIEAELAYDLAYPRNARVVCDLEDGTTLLIKLPKPSKLRLGVHAHAAELVHVELASTLGHRLSQAWAKKLQIWEDFEKTTAFPQVN